MFNSITKRLKGDQSQQPQSQPKANQEMEGFICPMCMASFTTPELVQQHFDTNHNDNEPKPTNNSILSPNTERKESIQNIQENFNDLKQSLDEEIWFNKELQKECGRLQNLLHEKEEELKTKNQSIESNTLKTSELENVRDILTDELKKIRITRDSMIGENETIKSNLDTSRAEINELLNTQKELQRIIDLQKVEHELIMEQLSSVKSSSDSSNSQLLDLASITEKYEMSQSAVQELKSEIETMTKSRENDSKEWKLECLKLTDTINSLESEKAVIDADHKKSISEIESQTHSQQSDNQHLLEQLELANKAVRESEDKILQMKRSWSADQSTLENTLMKLDEAVEDRKKLKSHAKELTQKAKAKDSELMQLRSTVTNKDEELKNIIKTNKSVTEELESVNRLLETEKNEKNQLQSQVQMTDAANLVMEQMQSEKKILQDNISNLKKQLENETERNNLEISSLKSEIQSQSETIFATNSLNLEKDEQIEEASKKNSEMLSNLDKYDQKIFAEIASRTELEDKIIALTRDLKSKDETLTTFHGNFNALKEDYDLLVKKSELEAGNLKSELSNLTNQLELAKSTSEEIELLQKDLELKNSQNQSLKNDIKLKAAESEILLQTVADLEKQNRDRAIESGHKDETITSLRKAISDQDTKIDNQSDKMADAESQIKSLNDKISKDSELIEEQVIQLSMSDNKMSELKEALNQTNEKLNRSEESNRNLEMVKENMQEENSSLKLEIEIMKSNLLDKEEVVTSLSDTQQRIENELTEKDHSIEILRAEFDQIQKKKYELLNELVVYKTQMDDIQTLYSDSKKLQNESQNNLEVTTVELNNTRKFLKDLEEEHKISQSEFSKETEHLKKEETQLKNHVKALTKTLNESSENYKQERLELAEKEFSLKSQCEELQTNLENLRTFLQRTEEDLETEKNLRESERNNMMEKISQLSEQISSTETLRSEYEHKLEIVETDNIESKLRLEVVNEEKEKLLEKIIQLENNLKKQTDLYSKKCREFDQLQSAILDLGRENQSLQISKEKLTNRQWIGDVEAPDCYTCRKLFSLTLRKHHCRNCGQVYCQDCSSKAASLAVSRKPVRVCDACFIEVQSHRRNSNASTSNTSLQI